MKIEIDAMKINQPIGEFYFGKISAKLLYQIAKADVRRLEDEERGVESYLGIQRPLKKSRVSEISNYLSTIDATFPNSIIIAINTDVFLDEDKNENVDQGEGEVSKINATWNGNKLTIEFDESETPKIATILDGQHRLAGFSNDNYQFEDYEGVKEDFELLVTIFVNSDMESQAKVFSMVNQNQTKVNKSLVYDLESISTSRSPWKSCHLIAVYFNSKESSPFYHRIKRLGVKTINQKGLEPLTQAAFVENLVKLISPIPQEDRNFILGQEKGFLSFSKKEAKFMKANDLIKYPFRKLFFDDQDEIIVKIVNSYFLAIKQTWPLAWDKENKDSVLNKTVGLIAFMRLLGIVLGKFINKVETDRLVTILNEANFATFMSLLEINENYFTDLDATSKTGSLIFREISEKINLTPDQSLLDAFKINDSEEISFVEPK